MSWADCGNDSEGRPIGYAFEAECDLPDCDKIIDHGLAYACGSMHGQNEFDCEKYFCEDHLLVVETPIGECISICPACYARLETDDDDLIIGVKEDA